MDVQMFGSTGEWFKETVPFQQEFSRVHLLQNLPRMIVCDALKDGKVRMAAEPYQSAVR